MADGFAEATPAKKANAANEGPFSRGNLGKYGMLLQGGEGKKMHALRYIKLNVRKFYFLHPGLITASCSLWRKF